MEKKVTRRVGNQGPEIRTTTLRRSVRNVLFLGRSLEPFRTSRVKMENK